jgi:redox-sensitive bicupin YhaK (pirin superfamily)
MSQTQHIRPDDLEWETFHDPHGRPTTPTRVLKSDGPFLIEAKFPAHFYADQHWHPYDTIYVVTTGEMRIGEEGAFRPGDIRWVKAGHTYGPEEAGSDGVQFHLFSLGGDIGLNWADLYDVPAELTERLAGFQAPSGRRCIDQMPLVIPGESCPGWDAMPDEGPLIFRMALAADAHSSDVSVPFYAVWYVRSGSIEIVGEATVGEGEFYCVSPDHSYSLTAGPEGAEWLVFSSQSLQPL